MADKIVEDIREYITQLRGKAARYYNYATSGGSDEDWAKNCVLDETADELEDLVNRYTATHRRDF
jgi:hypothetical protein